MTSRFREWLSAFLLFLAIATSAHASDILLNTDFSDGKTHWHGEGDPNGNSLVITLDPDKWTAVSQRFSANTAALKLIVNYSLSADCTLGKTGDRLLPPLTSAALSEACGVSSGINIPFTKYELWKVLVVSGGLLVTEELVPKFGPHGFSNNFSGNRTYSTELNTWLNSFDDCTLCLCFPPGQGSVTLTGVKLLPPGQ